MEQLEDLEPRDLMVIYDKDLLDAVQVTGRASGRRGYSADTRGNTLRQKGFAST